jgi:hypothetical protein
VPSPATPPDEIESATAAGFTVAATLTDAAILVLGAPHVPEP